MMKQIFLIFSLLLCFSGCSEFKRVHVSGTTTGEPDGAVIKVQSGNEELFSTNVVNNAFHLKGMIPAPGIYNLNIFSNNPQAETKSYLIYLNGGNCSIDFNTPGNNLYPIIKSDETIQNDLNRFYREYESLKKDVDSRQSFYAQLVDSLQKVDGQVDEYNKALHFSSSLIIERAELWDKCVEKFTNDNFSSELSAYFFANMEKQIEYDPRKYQRSFHKFSDDVQNSRYGVISKRFIEKYLNGSSGSKLPEVAGSDIYGNSLDRRVLKGKVTLVFFWLSTNTDSKNDIEILKGIYSKYHKEDLEIVAVCFDKEKDNWRKYILANKISWKNFHDDEGLSSKNFKNFGNKNIPYNFLVGPDLVISERNVPLEQFDLYFNTLKNNSPIQAGKPANL